MIRSLFTLVGLILACTGMVLFIAIGTWIWSLKTDVNRQTETLSSRANKTLDSADRAIGYVREVIEKAENDLVGARLEAAGARFKLTDQTFAVLKNENVPESVLLKLNPLKNKELPQEDLVKEIGKVLSPEEREQFQNLILNHATMGQTPLPPINPVIRFTAQKASQDLAGSVERAHSAIVAASEAVVVADAALNVVGGVPELKQLFGVKPEQLDATRTALGNVSSELLQARDVLGFPFAGPDASPTNEQLHAVDNALRQARGFTDEVGKVVESTRNRVNETKQTVDLWAWRGAVGTSAIAVLGVIGQFFMARFFWRLLRHKPA